MPLCPWKNLGSVPDSWLSDSHFRRKSIFNILRHLCLLILLAPATNPVCLRENMRIICNTLPVLAQPKPFDILSAFQSQICLWGMGDTISDEFIKVTHAHHYRVDSIVWSTAKIFQCPKNVRPLKKATTACQILLKQAESRDILIKDKRLVGFHFTKVVLQSSLNYPLSNNDRFNSHNDSH